MSSYSYFDKQHKEKMNFIILYPKLDQLILYYYKVIHIETQSLHLTNLRK